MADLFTLQGPLRDIRSYPAWTQDLVQARAPWRERVAQHGFFKRMRDARPGRLRIGALLVGAWPVVERLTQSMARNLLKVQFGRVPCRRAQARLIVSARHRGGR
ncbi:hypothetical protein [Pelomonas aquatica]|uniref:Uncharacterized protein n=1 Tax=Pelomonas aquatica TaxID=431058 RepID=A0A9X4R6Y8_9BURK|nr:hypothetical protein [Pelomonas aquatica]MCY4753957.1 hypothetical protein [Pelomonas aquatica]MDG0864854.1 hypothetical protein [Pelomonas aquatica]